MQIRDEGKKFLIKLERGEKVHESLLGFCEKRGIKSALYNGIGAVKNAEIGYYSLEKREYFFKTFPEDMEVASMTGNIAVLEGKLAPHTHVVLTRSEETLAAVGAHVKEAEVAVTLEVVLEPLGMPLDRKYDEEIGLNLWSI